MGVLYVVATPIGNLEDITLRALRVLKEVALIAAEDTRSARKLLDRYEISTPVISYWEHNEVARLDRLLAALQHSDVALISEAGTPCISDPGYRIVEAAVSQGFPVVPIPGPSAVVTAVSISALPPEPFLFLGFLPRTAGPRRSLLASVRDLPFTLVCFEAPHRILRALADMVELLGPRDITITRELTKMHEEIWRGTLQGALDHVEAQGPRGEFTLVIGRPSGEQRRWEDEEVYEAVARLVATGLEPKAAFRQVAQQSGWSRREIYDWWVQKTKS
jgi:16S rRNA (cytidine1402-2'-O)-methyltransferase